MPIEEKGVKPLVSIIMPAYNAERYLEECLASVEGQTYRDLEIILVDDGSTDETLRMARDHAARDERITVLTQQNQYAGVARNNGMAKASGDYLLFLDSDDIFEPDMVERLVARAEATEADAVVCKSIAFDEQTGAEYPLTQALCGVDLGAVESGEFLSEDLFQCFVGWPWDKLYRRSFVETHGLKFQPLRTTNDAYFVFMALALADRIAFVDKECVRHRVNNAASLEGSRAKSFSNAVVAAESIRSGLMNAGLYERFQRSYLNWFVDFSAWNCRTLQGDARCEYVSLMRKVLLPLLPPDLPEGYFSTELDEGVALALREEGDRLLEHAIVLECERAELKRRIRDLEEERADIIDHWRRDVEEVRSSTSFRLGAALLKVPCAIKDALKGKKAS